MFGEHAASFIHYHGRYIFQLGVMLRLNLHAMLVLLLDERMALV
jgi:hypothetical protein